MGPRFQERGPWGFEGRTSGRSPCSPRPAIRTEATARTGHDPGVDKIINFTNDGVVIGSDPIKARIDLWEKVWSDRRAAGFHRSWTRPIAAPSEVPRKQCERIPRMSDDLGDDLNRRDFMVAAIGASAALAATAGAARAQGTTVGHAAAASQATAYTGDVIDGKKVISALNIDDLVSGKKHLFYFQGVQMATGQHWYVSAMVAKGAKSGKRIVLVSGVHGDEISPVRMIQTVMDPSTRQKCRARYWPFWMCHAQRWRAWRGDGPIPGEASILSTSIASGPEMRAARPHLPGTPGCCSTGCSDRTLTTPSTSIPQQLE